ncbi:MAG: hypothetical protein ACRDLL_07515 [Solirubrobacterales bacterium]
MAADSDVPSVGSLAPRPCGGASVGSITAGGLTLLDVKGELDAPALRSWRGFVDSAITGGVTGVAVDLRGCGAIEYGCLYVLVTGSAELKARGGSGINLVTVPGSALERSVRAATAKQLPTHSSARKALQSLRGAG